MGSLILLTGTFASLIVLSVFALFAWFFPWVFALPLGILIYFPYEPDATSRYMRVTGPLTTPFAEEWVHSESIPKSCKTALVAAEDTLFFDHHGVDFDSLEKSYELNQKKKKIKRGGSTITQQLVKNAFLSRDKTYLRKAREVAGAFILDAFVSKDSQLTWYFNIVEFGPRVYGLEQAAGHYFKKHAGALTPAECISLVAILPAPNKWNASLAKKSPTSFFKRRYSVILARMQVMGLTSARDLQEARRSGRYTPVPLPPKDSPLEELPGLPEGDISFDGIGGNFNNTSNDTLNDTTSGSGSDALPPTNSSGESNGLPLQPPALNAGEATPEVSTSSDPTSGTQPGKASAEGPAEIPAPATQDSSEDPVRADPAEF